MIQWLRRILIPLALLICAPLFSGCLVGGSSEVRYTGTNVPASTFDQIEPGKTTVGWVKATLGEPTSKTDAGDHTVWKYTYTEHKDNSGYVFFIFGGSNTTEETHNAFIEFNKDEIVVNKWRG